jgi:hypothetical protein
MHRNFARSLGLLLALVAIVVLPGCPAPSGLINPKGKLTIDGNPAEGASVLFFPEGTPGSDIAAGATDSNGEFQLISNMEPGIAVGRYKVTVIWPDPAKKGTAEDAASGRSVDAPDLLKGRYANQAKSEISIEITPTTTELKPIELKSK